MKSACSSCPSDVYMCKKSESENTARNVFTASDTNEQQVRLSAPRTEATPLFETKKKTTGQKTLI